MNDTMTAYRIVPSKQ